MKKAQLGPINKKWSSHFLFLVLRQVKKESTMENSENKYSFDTTILKAVIERGPDFLMELFRLAMNEAMKMERENILNAGSYERTANRLGYANGFKPKTLNMRSGRVTVAIPQTRNCDFYPQSLQKGLRSERSLTMAMAEMYVQGVSTRKVKNILEKMCGLEVSSTQVSDAAKSLDEEIRLFKERRLGCYPVLCVDAEYQRVRTDGSVVDASVLQAVGRINAEGRREVVGMSLSTGEAEVHWRTFLTGLLNRGWRETDCKRRPCRIEGRESLRFPGSTMAAMLLPPVPKRTGLRPENRRAEGDREDHGECLFTRRQKRCVDGLARRGTVLGRDKETRKVRRMAGEQRRGIHDLLQLQRRLVATRPAFKPHRTAEQGNQEKDEGRGSFPQPGILRTARRLAADGTARGMDGR